MNVTEGRSQDQVNREVADWLQSLINEVARGNYSVVSWTYDEATGFDEDFLRYREGVRIPDGEHEYRTIANVKFRLISTGKA